MHATVYQLCSHGLRLPRPQQGVSGHLHLEPTLNGSGRTKLRAKLVDERSQHTSLLPDLHDAAVVRITANGIKIIGSEVIARRTNNKSAADHYRQVWWCLVHTVFVAESLDLVEIDENFRPVIPGLSSEG